MKQFIFTLLCAGVVSNAFAQSSEVQEVKLVGPPRCLFNEALHKAGVNYNQLSEAYAQNIAPAGTAQKGTATVYDIPVVFHIVYSAATPTLNLHDSVIKNQVQILNEAFRKTHADVSKTRNVFKPLSADVQIQFHLATKDPSGAPSTGITRTISSRNYFGSAGGDLDSLERVKSTSAGGKDPWPTNRYYNIWVCNMADNAGQLSVLGYGTPPLNPLPDNWPKGADLELAGLKDGVVIQTHAVGSNNPIAGPVKVYYTRGRALVHETGHYLGLQHVFGAGDGTNPYCGTPIQDDGMGDTPEQSMYSFTPGSTPSGTKNSCGTGTGDSVDMWENYMDYTVDSFQTMFTLSQATLVRGVLANQRSGLVSTTTSVQQTANLPATVIYPNPATSFIQLKYSEKIAKVQVTDVLGRSIINLTGADAMSMKYDVSGLAAGNYILQVENDKGQRSVGRFTVLR